MKKYLFLPLICLILAGCAGPGWISGFVDSKKEPTNKYNYDRHVTVTPQYIVMKKAGISDSCAEEISKNVAVANKVEITESTNIAETPAVKLNLLQRLWNRFKWWIILAILIFVPGASTVAIFAIKRSANLAIKGAKETAEFFQIGMKQTVDGVEEYLKTAKDEAAKEELKTKLGKNMDNKIKVLVAELKHKKDIK